MRVQPLLPDAPVAPQGTADASEFVRALDAIGDALTGATRAEDDFAYGHGSLHEAVYERARADIALSVATSTAQRVAQAVQSVLNMQV